MSWFREARTRHERDFRKALHLQEQENEQMTNPGWEVFTEEGLSPRDVAKMLKELKERRDAMAKQRTTSDARVRKVVNPRSTAHNDDEDADILKSLREALPEQYGGRGRATLGGGDVDPDTGQPNEYTNEDPTLVAIRRAIPRQFGGEGRRTGVDGG